LVIFEGLVELSYDISVLGICFVEKFELIFILLSGIHLFGISISFIAVLSGGTLWHLQS
jgi:hypothetical protein